MSLNNWKEYPIQIRFSNFQKNYLYAYFESLDINASYGNFKTKQFEKSSKNREARIRLAFLLNGCIHHNAWPIYFKTKEEVEDFLTLCDELGLVG